MSYKLKYTGQQVQDYLTKVATGQVGGTDDYNTLENRPVINADISSVELVADTYYKHTGEDGTYKTGVIYYYNGTKLIAIDGGTSITLNGEETDNATIYAPTSGGSSTGIKVLVPHGDGNEPTWEELKLTKDVDTHTLTLGGKEVGTFEAPVYAAGNGLQQTGNEFSIKTDSEYLRVSANGLDVNASGIADLAMISLNGSYNRTINTRLYAPTSAGSKDNILFSNGSGEPAWGSFKVNNGTALDKSIFAPVTAGSSGQVLLSNESGAPSWSDFTVNEKSVGGQSIYAPTTTRSSNSYDSCYVLVPNDRYGGAPTWERITVTKSSDDLVYTLKLGSVEFGKIKLTQEVYLDSVVFDKENNDIIFTYNTASGKAQIRVELDELMNIYEAGAGLQQTGNEFSIKSASKYLSASTSGLDVNASGIADLAKIKNFNGNTKPTKDTSFYAPTRPGSDSDILFSNGSGEPAWGSFKVNNGTANGQSIYAPTISSVSNMNNSCYVLVPNGPNSAPIWKKLTVEKNGLVYTLKVGDFEFGKIELIQDIYLDDVTYDKDNNRLIFTYNTASGKSQIEVDLTNLVDINGTSTTLIANTEQELDALLATKNIGKFVNYKGLVYAIMGNDIPITNAPIEVGDIVDTLYFNTSLNEAEILSSFSQLDGSGDILVTGPNYRTALEYVDFGQEGAYNNAKVLAFYPLDGDWQIIYSTESFYYGSKHIRKGWNVDQIPCGLEVTKVNHQDIWGILISKEPFQNGSGGIIAKPAYEAGTTLIAKTEEEMNALLVPENVGKLVTYNEALYTIIVPTPIAVGDTINKLYFNTNLSDEEMLTKLSALTYDEYGYALLFGDSNHLVAHAANASISTGGAINAYFIIIDTGEGTVIPYSTETFKDENSGISATKGWSTDHIVLSSSSQRLVIVDQRDLWDSYISKEPFTSGSGVIIAKPVCEAGNGLAHDNGVFSIKIAPDSEKYLKATANGLVFDESALPTGLPEVTTEDVGKFLRVDANGKWTAQSIPNAEEASF